MGKKRRLWTKWGIMLVMIGLITIQTKAYGQSWNWELFLKDADCDFYYDPDTVTRLPENIVRVCADLRKDGHYRTIEIVANDRKNFRVRARRGYYSPTQ